MPELTFDLLRPLERFSVFTPLGIHFWDPARNTPVSDGLQVTARPEAAPGPVVHAFRTGSGVYAFRGLPGLRRVEYPMDEEQTFDASPPETRPFIIEVTDRKARFLPLVFRVELPLPYTGIYRPTANGSPPVDGNARFYLFSAPTRTPSPGLAVVRAHMVEHEVTSPPVDASGRSPARHAVLEVEIDGKAWFGIADDEGRVAVFFPYPTFFGSLFNSPPGTGGLITSPPGIPPTEQEWELTVRVRYSSGLTPAPFSRFPKLVSIWNQPTGRVWPTEAGPPVDQWPQQLRYGQELVLRSGNEWFLSISSGGSPP
jgi:hypothetical protein